ncbi:TRAF3-interacting JNK-activating modulator-like [Bufo bufo]|uniref:TRAF3-interacting JNK-activating modulator-like n=1 Tax=Bufo bufo TaxID=8384 RepID=UPI001ABDABE2|nr:TRAF3-interacting JNK-activating modulator-like [Bufo bufo]
MTARQKRDSRATGKVSSDLGHSSQSLYTSRAHKSESLPSIAGIGLGIQDVRSVSSVPVTKTTKSFLTIVKPEKPGKSAVSKAVQVSSNEEHLLLSKIEALKKEMCLLKSSLKEKDNLVTELNEIIKTKTMQFTREMENEINGHKTTRQTLERSQRIVEEKEQLLTESIQHHEKVQQDLQDQYEEMLASLREQTQKEVNTRDERINKLKQQISELFKDKSWEHKKQIEELQKELKRLAEEAHVLRGQLKRHNVSTHECGKCKSLMSALEDSRLQLKLKNRTIEELQSVCQGFQHQLQEQEKLQSLLVDKDSRNQK